MKKAFLVTLIVMLTGAAIAAYFFNARTTSFEGKKKFVYIPTGTNSKEAVLSILKKDSVLRQPWLFNLFADRLDYWKQIKPGKYEVPSGMNTFQLVRKLRSGQQTPVNLVINKVRTGKQLAQMVGNKFECDSAAFLETMYSREFLSAHGLDSATAISLVIPDTYTYYWNSDPAMIFSKLVKRHKDFWNEERKAKAAAKGLTPAKVYTVASIVEEETNNRAEKGNVASVYLNRIKIGMPLQADPTVKFALQDFTLKRIYQKHLTVSSPYNTYRVKGLPPGPICTPSSITIDEVLNAPETKYIYFVASSQFNGTHVFAADYPTHLKYAKEYQKALDSLFLKRQQKADTSLGK